MVAKKTVFFCKTEKFIRVSQLAGEDDSDYLQGVERLSHDAGFDYADTLRRCYCFELSINSLRNRKLQMELMV